MSGSGPTLALRDRLPVGLFGMLALMAAVEAFVASRGAYLRDTGDWGWAVAGKASRSADSRREILAFGDSLMKLGVAPDLVQARAGRSAYNLAVCGGQAPSSYFLLRRALDSGARPAALLVDFFPRLQQIGPRHTLLWPALLEPRETLELAWVARDPELFASILAARMLPSVRARQGIRSAVMTGSRNALSGETPTYRRNWRRNLGAQIMPCGADPGSDYVKCRKDFYSDLNFDPVNVTFMHRFLALAMSRAIPVYYLIPPIKPGLQAECERSGFDAAYLSFLKAIESRYPNVVMVDGRHASYDPALFYDANHLGRDGAWAYSVALGDLLRRHMAKVGGPRWIEVPKYGGLPGGTPPEDVNQSRDALLAGGRPGGLR